MTKEIKKIETMITADEIKKKIRRGDPPRIAQKAGISLRQYYRYLNGEYIMPLRIIKITEEYLKYMYGQSPEQNR